MTVILYLKQKHALNQSHAIKERLNCGLQVASVVLFHYLAAAECVDKFLSVDLVSPALVLPHSLCPYMRLLLRLKNYLVQSERWGFRSSPKHDCTQRKMWF